MRIVITCRHRTIVGGVETYLRDILRALRERGHTVGLLTSGGAVPGDTPLHPPNLDVPTWNLAEMDRAQLFADVAAWEPDLVFQHGLASPADEELLVQRHPAVLFAHGHAATCVSGSRTLAFPTLRPCARSLSAACLLHYFPRRCGGLNPLTMVRLYREARHREGMLSRYREVIVTSHSMEDEYRRHGVAPDRLHRVPLFPTAVTPDYAAPPARAFTDRVLMVGRLYREKGGCLLVDAMSRANVALGRPLTLAVAGDGPEQPRMQALAARRGLAVEFHGWVGAEQRQALMRGADLLAVPSVCPETFGLVGVEAGCVGLPAIGFAVGGIPDWLIPGETGELAPADPPTAVGLAGALCRAVASPVHWSRLSRGAWETARRHSLEAHVSRLEAILAQAVTPDPHQTPCMS